MNFKLIILIVLLVIVTLIMYTSKAEESKEFMNDEIPIGDSDVSVESEEIVDDQLDIMKNGKNKYLPHENQIADASLSKTDAAIIAKRRNEKPFTSWNELSGMNTVTQPKKFMSLDNRVVPQVQPIEDDRVLFNKPTAGPDLFKGAIVGAHNPMAASDALVTLTPSIGHPMVIGR